jgi:HNH endonuclease
MTKNKNNQFCLKCSKSFQLHDNSIVHWGLCALSANNFSKSVKKYKIFGKCFGWCNQKLYPPSLLTVHHKFPKTLGGSNSPSNCIVLCRNCHDYTETLINELNADHKSFCVFYAKITQKNDIKKLKRQAKIFYKKELSMHQISNPNLKEPHKSEKDHNVEMLADLLYNIPDPEDIDTYVHDDYYSCSSNTIDNDD